MLQDDERWYFLPPLVGTQTRFPTVSAWSGTVTAVLLCEELFEELVAVVLLDVVLLEVFLLDVALLEVAGEDELTVWLL